mgnify:FL=1
MTSDTLHHVIRSKRRIALDRYRQLSADSSVPNGSIDVEGAFSVHEWIERARRMCQCVQALHKQGIVHMDLKPSQFMQFSGRHWKLIDFGSCVDIGSGGGGWDDKGSSVRNAASLAVTENYCAPEIHRAASERRKVRYYNYSYYNRY